jgi:valyl-tRNA synthetase
VDKKPKDGFSFRVQANEYFIPLVGMVDLESEKLTLTNELDYTKQFLASVEKKLSNKKFVKNAPQKVLENEQKKQVDALAKIATISASLEKIS